MNFDLGAPIHGLAVHPRRSNFLVVGAGHDVRLYNHVLADEKLVQKKAVTIASGGVDVAFTPDGNQFVSATSSTGLKVYDLEKLSVVNRIPFEGDRPNVLCQTLFDRASSDFKMDIVTGTENGKILCFDMREPSVDPCIEFEAHEYDVNYLHAFSHNKMLSVGDDAVLLLSDLRNKKTLQESIVMEGIPKHICYCKQSAKVLVSTYEKVYVFNSKDIENGILLKAHPPTVTPGERTLPTCAISLADGNQTDRFAIGYADSKYLTLLDTKLCRWTQRIPTRVGTIERPTVPNGGRFYFVGDDDSLCSMAVEDAADLYDVKLNVPARKYSATDIKMAKNLLSDLIEDNKQKSTNHDDDDSDENIDDEDESISVDDYHTALTGDTTMLSDSCCEDVDGTDEDELKKNSSIDSDEYEFVSVPKTPPC